jgi:hypothetical protein
MLKLSPDHGQNKRVERNVRVRLFSADESRASLGSESHTINVSEHGLLMEVPAVADVVLGQDVIVVIDWEGGTFESRAEVVRFESPYWKDHWSSVMGLRLEQVMPPDLLKHSTS